MGKPQAGQEAIEEGGSGAGMLHGTTKSINNALLQREWLKQVVTAPVGKPKNWIGPCMERLGRSPREHVSQSLAQCLSQGPVLGDTTSKVKLPSTHHDNPLPLPDSSCHTGLKGSFPSVITPRSKPLKGTDRGW